MVFLCMDAVYKRQCLILLIYDLNRQILHWGVECCTKVHGGTTKNTAVEEHVFQMGRRTKVNTGTGCGMGMAFDIWPTVTCTTVVFVKVKCPGTGC